MPRGGGGKKKFGGGHKGASRHFSTADEIKLQQEQIAREKERGLGDDEGQEGKSGAGSAQKHRIVDFDKKTTREKERSDTESSSSESEEEGDSDGDDKHHKGVTHLIDVNNPNKVVQKTKKVSDLNLDRASSGASSNATSGLSRKEREAIENEQKRQAYLRLHAQGKTDEAQRDLARLQIIRKQREEAAKKREQETKAKEAAKEAVKEEAIKGQRKKVKLYAAMLSLR